MSLKFACNISWMFKEHDFLDRFRLAAEAGFKGVEAAFPYEYSTDELQKAKEEAGVEHILINSSNAARLGCAAVPGLNDDFESEIKQAIEYADALNCKRIHIMAGKFDNANSKNVEDFTNTFVNNLSVASALLRKDNIVGLIEFINNKPATGAPTYFLTTPEQAQNVISKVNQDNIQLMIDMYHLQIMSGNLTANLKTLLPKTGHIQISQVPGRNEPHNPGEINYDYIFQLLSDLRYQQWIGCEYNPKGTTDEGLGWYNNYLE